MTKNYSVQGLKIDFWNQCFYRIFWHVSRIQKSHPIWMRLKVEVDSPLSALWGAYGQGPRGQNTQKMGLDWQLWVGSTSIWGFIMHEKNHIREVSIRVTKKASHQWGGRTSTPRPVRACKQGPLEVMLNWVPPISYLLNWQELLEAEADKMPSRSVYDKHT